MDQGIVIILQRIGDVGVGHEVRVPKMSQKSVQMGHENAMSAKYAMAKTLGKMLKC